MCKALVSDVESLEGLSSGSLLQLQYIEVFLPAHHPELILSFLNPLFILLLLLFSSASPARHVAPSYDVMMLYVASCIDAKRLLLCVFCVLFVYFFLSIQSLKLAQQSRVQGITLEIVLPLIHRRYKCI